MTVVEAEPRRGTPAPEPRDACRRSAHGPRCDRARHAGPRRRSFHRSDARLVRRDLSRSHVRAALELPAREAGMGSGLSPDVAEALTRILWQTDVRDIL